MYHVYVLKSIFTGRYYIGSTNDLDGRLRRHNAKLVPSTKRYSPWGIIYSETFNTLSEARQREQKIKSWKNPRYMIEALGIIT